MRLWVLSDLHLEQAHFAPDSETDVAAGHVDQAADPDRDGRAGRIDAVVLAGDTAPGTAGVAWAAATFGSLPVLYLAGNHEFYGFQFPGLIEDLRRAAAGTSVHVLERDELVLEGVRFLGCTLWTAFDSAGEERRPSTMRFAERVSNDYKLIRTADGGRLRAQDTLAEHRRSRDWLAKRLARPHDGPTVVLTHHVPFAHRRPDSLVAQALGGTIVSDLGDLIGATRPDLWIYGHSHRAADGVHAGTRLLSNPRGYPREHATGFDPGLVVEVPAGSPDRIG